MKPRVAILDDTQNVAAQSADWTRLAARCEIKSFSAPFASEDEAAEKLAGFDILVAMRERTAFPESLIARLPRLKLIALTGARSPSLDLKACAARGIVVSNTRNDYSHHATAELALTLLLAAARMVPLADSTMKSGGWHAGVPLGTTLHGRTLGILGLGKLGAAMAAYGRALGMNIIAWSQNLTDAAAEAAGARRVEKLALFQESDALSIHLVLSARTRGLIGAAELAALKDGAILINTSRGPIIDEAALVAELRKGRIRAGLDVFDQEPLPENHPLRGFPNAILTPHLGYGAGPVFRQWYEDSIENILAFLDGKPIRVISV